MVFARWSSAPSRSSRRRGEGEQDHLIGADVAVALHQVEVGRPQVRADGDLDVAARPPAARASRRSRARRRSASASGSMLNGIPALAEVGDAPERRVALAAEVDRRVRLLDRLRVLAAGRQRRRTRPVVSRPDRTRAAHHLQVLAAARRRGARTARRGPGTPRRASRRRRRSRSGRPRASRRWRPPSRCRRGCAAARGRCRCRAGCASCARRETTSASNGSRNPTRPPPGCARRPRTGTASA